ncbi:MAG: TPM domain-containing protein [Deltaproteobacteria bacterium]|nr:TPM domain-containing protein [Deltaproteobacteria bacterium]
MARRFQSTPRPQSRGGCAIRALALLLVAAALLWGLGLAWAASARAMTCAVGEAWAGAEKPAAILPTPPPEFWQKRPGPPGRRVFDQAGVLSGLSESLGERLAALERAYHLEAVVVSLPALPRGETPGDAARRLLTAWQVGGKLGNRGMVVLLVRAAAKVRLEVSPALEPVFTDAFLGRAADQVLLPYCQTKEAGAGVTAVLELVEERARAQGQAAADPQLAARAGAAPAAGGGGVIRGADATPAPVPTPARAYPAGDTPLMAWQNLVAVWRDQVRAWDLGVYPAVARLIMRGFTGLPASRLAQNYHTYGARTPQVRQAGDYAVIWFGPGPGWDQAPFLLARGPGGWQFDLVNQRKWVRMGPSPRWGIERGDHPYVALTRGAEHWLGQDIPWEPADRYDLSRDAAWARELAALEERAAAEHLDPAGLLALARLYVCTAQGLKALPLLARARELTPDAPRLHKLAALAHHCATYQYQTAAREMGAYTAARPNDAWGWKYLGYLELCRHRLGTALQALEKARKLDPDDVYARAKQARGLALAWQQAEPSAPGRELLRQKALAALTALRLAAPDSPRTAWLAADFQTWMLTPAAPEGRP